MAKRATKKKFKEVHSTNRKIGMGDFLGTGVPNRVGRTLSGTVGDVPVSKKGLKKAPKSLA